MVKKRHAFKMFGSAAIEPYEIRKLFFTLEESQHTISGPDVS